MRELAKATRGFSLKAADQDQESDYNNLLSVGIKDGTLMVFDKKGVAISGTKGLKITAYMNELVEVEVRVLVNKDFMICDSINIGDEFIEED